MNYKKILKKINSSSKKIATLSDEELQKQTDVIRELIKKNASETSIIIKAFSVVREADKRILGLYPNDEQVLGAIALFYGNIAEMKTGEGKTLVATMPLYLRALQMPGVYLVTTNDYLATRDYEKNIKLFEWLGLTISNGTAETEDELDVEDKKTAYKADIIYTSNGALGFDYLIDGLASKIEDKYIGEFNYAILDEVDAILLDSAQTPLLISGAPKVQSNFFESSCNFVITLTEDVDYELSEDRSNVWFTAEGINKAKDYFSISNLLSREHFLLYQHLVIALKAEFTLIRNKNYIVEDDKVKLIDFQNGRILEGTNLQSGLHQALEVKENVEITNESQTISSITFQNLFRKFKILSGMTGTAKTNESEFIETYNLPVIQIKTHKKSRRVDHKRQQFVTFDQKVEASLNQIIELHKTGRPVLVITGSVDSSELFSNYLFNLGIPHGVLNAKNSAKEAMIVKEAGNHNAVTVATSMAGRGTDIVLDSESIKLGGLAVVLTEAMSSLRIELQAKGRSGRQGLPGDTYSYESLEDDVIKTNIQESIQKYYDKNIDRKKPIRNVKVKRSFKLAQQKSEDNGRSSRLSNLEFDEILKVQKAVVDNSRDEILNTTSIEKIKKFIIGNAEKVITEYFKGREVITDKTVKRFILDNINYNFKEKQYSGTLFNVDHEWNVEEAVDISMTNFKNSLSNKKNFFEDDTDAYLQFLKIVILKAIDVNWTEQVDSLNQLKSIVQTRESAQRNPILEYALEVKNEYEYQRKEVTKEIMRNSALSMIQISKGELIVTFP